MRGMSRRDLFGLSPLGLASLHSKVGDLGYWRLEVFEAEVKPFGCTLGQLAARARFIESRLPFASRAPFRLGDKQPQCRRALRVGGPSKAGTSLEHSRH